MGINFPGGPTLSDSADGLWLCFLNLKTMGFLNCGSSREPYPFRVYVLPPITGDTMKKLSPDYIAMYMDDF